MRQWLVAASLLALSSGSVAAEPFLFEPDDSPVYARVGFGAVHVWLPEVNGFGTIINDEPFFFVRQFEGDAQIKAPGFNGELALGLNLNELGATGFFADTRFEFSASGFDLGQHIDNSTTLGSDEYLDLISYDTGVYVDSLGFPGETVVQDGDLDVWQAEGKFFLFKDYRGDGVGFGPASFGVGTILGVQKQDYQVKYTNITNPMQYVSSEDVEMLYIGPAISGDFAFPLGEGTTLHVNGTLAALFVDSELDARQQITDGSTIQRKDGQSNWSFRGSLGAGLEFDLWGPVTATVGGEFTYWSHVAQIVNPRSGPGIEADDFTFDPARLVSDDAYSATFGVTLSIPIGPF